MLSSIKSKTVVKKGGRIEIESPELHEGDEVEVIVLTLKEEDTTMYLLSNDTNRKHLRESLNELENREAYVYVDPSKL